MNELGLLDIKALNAGYLADSHCLYRKAEEILRELKVNTPELEDEEFSEIVGSLKKEGLVEESIERLQISWDNISLNRYVSIFLSCY